MFVGDTMKSEAETIIRKLRPALQMRLRFIAHLTVEEINNKQEIVAQTNIQTNALTAQSSIASQNIPSNALPTTVAMLAPSLNSNCSTQSSLLNTVPTTGLQL